MGKERFGCIVDSWFSDRRRMGLAALVSAILAVFSILLNFIISPILGKNDLVTGVTMMMAFVFIAGFSVAFAVFLVLCLEGKFKSS